MHARKAEKVAVVEEVRDRLASTKGVIVTEYRGLAVSELAELRTQLRATGCSYKVYKNTLVKRACREGGVEQLEPLLVARSALAFVEGEPGAVAKALRDFSRSNPALVIKGGILENRYLSDADTATLASLPSRDVLLARVSGALVGSLQRFLWSLKALPQSFAYALAELASKQGSGELNIPEIRQGSDGEVSAVQTVGVEAGDRSAVEDGVPPSNEESSN